MIFEAILRRLFTRWEGCFPEACPMAGGLEVVSSYRNLPLGQLGPHHIQPLCTEPLQPTNYSMPDGTRGVFQYCIWKQANTIVMYSSIKKIYESDCIELDLFNLIIVYTLAVTLKEEIQIRGSFCLFFSWQCFTCDTGKTVGDDPDYRVNNVCLRIWLQLSLLLVLNFVGWFICRMPVNPVASASDVIFLMSYTCCTSGKKAATCLTFYCFSFLLAHIVYIHSYFIRYWGIYSKVYIYRKREENYRCLFTFVFSITDISHSRQTIPFVSFT